MDFETTFNEEDLKNLKEKFLENINLTRYYDYLNILKIKILNYIEENMNEFAPILEFEVF